MRFKIAQKWSTLSLKYTKNISKICQPSSNFRWVESKKVRPEMKNFWTGSEKICHRKAYKNCFEIFSFFDIINDDGAKSLLSFINCYDFITGSCLNHKILIDFGGFGTNWTKFWSLFLVSCMGLAKLGNYRRPSDASWRRLQFIA